MAHRRASGGTFSFDLEPDDDETIEVDPVEPTRVGRVAGAWGARVRSWPRRRVVAVAVVAGVALAGTIGTVSVNALARERAWARVAATAPGAVLDVGHAPVETWRVPLVTPTLLGLVGDVLVVQSSAWESARGPMLYGIDLGRREVAWTAPSPEGMSCSVGTPDTVQVSPEPALVRGDVVVCLSGDGREVAVIDGAGALVAQRVLADAPPELLADALFDGSNVGAAHRAHATADGGLVRLDRVGPVADPPALEPVDPEQSPLLAPGVQSSQGTTARLLEPLELAPSGCASRMPRPVTSAGRRCSTRRGSRPAPSSPTPRDAWGRARTVSPSSRPTAGRWTPSRDTGCGRRRAGSTPSSTCDRARSSRAATCSATATARETPPCCRWATASTRSSCSSPVTRGSRPGSRGTTAASSATSRGSRSRRWRPTARARP